MCFSAMRAKLTGQEAYQTEYLDISKIKFNDFAGIDPKKTPGSDDRFYPKWWTQVLRSKGNELEFSPLRYQLLPHFAEKNKYTMKNPKTGRDKEIKTFNARLDGLETRLAWRNLFGKKHGLLPLKAFYEWVPSKGKPKLIEFKPSSGEILWTACLWDKWTDGKEEIESFAIITDDPHPDVISMGHDRTPIFLKEDCLQYWLNPEKETSDELYEILREKKQLSFDWSWVD